MFTNQLSGSPGNRETALRDLPSDNGSLLEMALAGDQNAWSEIVRRYEGSVRAAAASFRLGPADTNDAVQSTWLRLFEHACAIREPDKLGGWLATTARRECLAIIRSHRLEGPLDMTALNLPSAEPTPEAAAVASDVHARVRAATNALSGRPRALIDALYYRPCHSYTQVAHDIGMPIGSIGPTRIRTLQSLRHTLTHLGYRASTGVSGPARHADVLQDAHCE